MAVLLGLATLSVVALVAVAVAALATLVGMTLAVILDVRGLRD
jgi:hypothetical protein